MRKTECTNTMIMEGERKEGEKERQTERQTDRQAGRERQAGR